MVALSAGARRWLVDAALAVAVLVVAEIAIVSAHEAESIPRNWLAYLLGVAMAAPVLLRRRHPLAELYVMAAVLLAYYAIGFPGFPPGVVLVLPLYDAARAGRSWLALPVPLILLGIGMVVAIRKGSPPLEVVNAFLPQVGLVAVLLVGALVRSRHAYAVQTSERLRDIQAAREREAERRVMAERLRIARELHDTVSHAVSTITVQSGAALYLMDDHPDQARDALTAIRHTSKEALAEMRTTLGVLRSTDGSSTDTEPGAGLDRLPSLLTAVRAAGLNVSVHSGLDAQDHREVPVDVDHAAYRIVQESLTNVLRHAGPDAQAEVRLRVDTAWLLVEIDDNGVGAAEDTVVANVGHGLIGMAERAADVGGRVEPVRGSTGVSRYGLVCPWISRR